jgi:lysophospholipase L1-like esterase
VAVASVHDQFHGHESASPNCGTAPPRTVDTWIQYPLLPLTSGRNNLADGNDCFHPNPAGHAQIANTVWGVAQALLPLPQTAVQP